MSLPECDASPLVIAYHLPQFHEIEENNHWWGDGYTEWVALEKWKSLYEGHEIINPHPDIGYYNLKDHGTFEAQHKVAKSYHISTFAVWYYYFGIKDRLMEKALDAALANEEDFKFCLAWANHSWFNKKENILLKRQTYDFTAQDFYQESRKYFIHKNYRIVNNRPVLIIYKPLDIPDLQKFCLQLNECACQDGFDGMYLIFEQTKPNENHAVLAEKVVNSVNFLGKLSIFQKLIYHLIQKYQIKVLRKYDYKVVIKNFTSCGPIDKKAARVIFTGWDTTPRHGIRGVVVTGLNNNTFKEHCLSSMRQLKTDDVILVKSWNEWAEGNALEPSTTHGYDLLQIFRDCLNEYN